MTACMGGCAESSHGCIWSENPVLILRLLEWVPRSGGGVAFCFKARAGDPLRASAQLLSLEKNKALQAFCLTGSGQFRSEILCVIYVLERLKDGP